MIASDLNRKIKKCSYHFGEDTTRVNDSNVIVCTLGQLNLMSSEQVDRVES